MRILIPICFLLFCPVVMQAQLVQGTVSDKDTRGKISGAMVINKRTQAYTRTNDSGFYMLQAALGDTIIFMSATHNTTRKAVVKKVEDMNMTKTTYSLDEVEIVSDMARHELEHEEMLKTYDKTIKDARRKPKFRPQAGTSPGFTIDGFFSNLASNISGKRKRDKRFLSDFEQMENDKYVALRYNPDVVVSATHTTNDSAVAFINANPMEMDMAREASYLELMMWIREHFNKWANKEKQTATPKGAD